MKLLHVISSLDLAEGGPAHAVRRMATLTAEAGHEVAIATLVPPTASFDGCADGDHDVRILPFVRAPLGLGRFLFGTASQYDLLHIHGFFDTATHLAATAARRAQVPYLLRPAGQLDPWSLSQKAWKKRPYYRLFGRADLTGAKLVHVTSELEARGIRRLQPSILPVVVPNSVAWPKEVSRPVRSNTLRVLYLSRLHHKKRPEDLIRAVSSMVSTGKAVHLTLAGPAAPNYVASLAALVRRERVEQHVTFHGFVEHAHKAHLFARHDVFALPSSQENFGIAVIEAMAHGLPVVISDQVAVAEEVRAVDAGTVVPLGDVAALCGALESYRDETRRANTGRNARAWIAARYTDARVRGPLLALYEQALQR